MSFLKVFPEPAISTTIMTGKTLSKTSEKTSSKAAQSPREVIQRHCTFLHSEPIVHKILIKSPDDEKDCYGLDVGKKYVNIRVDGKVNSQPYLYQGGWLGGKLN
jgi:hypothetical protein